MPPRLFGPSVPTITASTLPDTCAVEGCDQRPVEGAYLCGAHWAAAIEAEIKAFCASRQTQELPAIDQEGKAH